jgi:hypothetical protein
MAETTTTPLGALEVVDPRLVWKNEAHDFTPWLLGHGDLLADALGIDVELEASEHAVGGFSLDLVGRDITNDAVLIVENQLEGTDHSHLGQVLTYAAGTAASTIVWIATGFRDEHRQALDWLNENTGEDTHFFGIELQVVRIGDSPYAPLFNVVAQPNDWQKRARAATQSSALSEKAAAYLEFWGRFLERVHAEHPSWTSGTSVSHRNWYEMKGPKSGCRYSSSFSSQDTVRQEFYIDTGDGDENTLIYEQLFAAKDQIEATFGGPLSWQDLPERRACRLAVDLEGGRVMDRERWDEYIDWFIETGLRLRRSLDPMFPL